MDKTSDSASLQNSRHAVSFVAALSTLLAILWCASIGPPCHFPGGGGCKATSTPNGEKVTKVDYAAPQDARGLTPNEWGDSWGGVTGLATVLTLLAALFTMRLQLDEIARDRHERRKQDHLARLGAVMAALAAMPAVVERKRSKAKALDETVTNMFTNPRALLTSQPWTEPELEKHLEEVRKKHREAVVQLTLAEAMEETLYKMVQVSLIDLPKDWDSLDDTMSNAGRVIEALEAQANAQLEDALGSSLDDAWKELIGLHRAMKKE